MIPWHLKHCERIRFESNGCDVIKPPESESEDTLRRFALDKFAFDADAFRADVVEADIGGTTLGSDSLVTMLMQIMEIPESWKMRKSGSPRIAIVSPSPSMESKKK